MTKTQIGNRWFNGGNNLFSTGTIYVGNPTHRHLLSNDIPSRTSTGIPKKPTVIDRAWERSQRPSIKRARDRLQSATPICDDPSLLKLDEEVAEYVREAKRRDTLEPDELVSTVVDAVARSYFQHMLRKQARVTPVRRRTRA